MSMIKKISILFIAASTVLCTGCSLRKYQLTRPGNVTKVAQEYLEEKYGVDFTAISVTQNDWYSMSMYRNANFKTDAFPYDYTSVSVWFDPDNNYECELEDDYYECYMREDATDYVKDVLGSDLDGCNLIMSVKDVDPVPDSYITFAEAHGNNDIFIDICIFSQSPLGEEKETEIMQKVADARLHGFVKFFVTADGDLLEGYDYGEIDYTDGLISDRWDAIRNNMAYENSRTISNNYVID